MKTTNFEISKKLEEIGFKPKNEESQIWNYDGQIRWKYPSYDFETLLDALPKKIQFKQKEYCFWMQWSGCSDCLLLGYVYGNLRAIELEVWQLENESLADTAGRLLIQLFEAGIINFNK